MVLRCQAIKGQRNVPKMSHRFFPDLQRKQGICLSKTPRRLSNWCGYLCRSEGAIGLIRQSQQVVSREAEELNSSNPSGIRTDQRKTLLHAMIFVHCSPFKLRHYNIAQDDQKRTALPQKSRATSCTALPPELASRRWLCPADISRTISGATPPRVGFAL